MTDQHTHDILALDIERQKDAIENLATILRGHYRVAGQMEVHIERLRAHLRDSRAELAKMTLSEWGQGREATP